MNHDTNTTAGKASPELLVDLWRLLVADLCRLLAPSKTRRGPPVAVLAVARAMVRDNRQGSPDEDAGKKLDDLYRLYLARLSESLESNERPSAALLAEARCFLSWLGYPDIPAAAAGKTAQHLLAADVPFKATRH